MVILWHDSFKGLPLIDPDGPDIIKHPILLAISPFAIGLGIAMLIFLLA